MLSLSQPVEEGRDGLQCVGEEGHQCCPCRSLRRRVVMGYNAFGRKAINVVLAAACGGGS